MTRCQVRLTALYRPSESVCSLECSFSLTIILFYREIGWEGGGSYMESFIFNFFAFLYIFSSYFFFLSTLMLTSNVCSLSYDSLRRCRVRIYINFFFAAKAGLLERRAGTCGGFLSGESSGRSAKSKRLLEMVAVYVTYLHVDRCVCVLRMALQYRHGCV